jgi:hypothetical protein
MQLRLDRVLWWIDWNKGPISRGLTLEGGMRSMRRQVRMGRWLAQTTTTRRAHRGGVRNGEHLAQHWHQVRT